MYDWIATRRGSSHTKTPKRGRVKGWNDFFERELYVYYLCVTTDPVKPNTKNGSRQRLRLAQLDRVVPIV